MPSNKASSGTNATSRSSGAAAAGSAAAPSTVTIDAMELRALAEHADGKRQKRLYLVATGDPGHPVGLNENQGEQPTIEILTKTNQKFSDQAKLSTTPPLNTDDPNWDISQCDAVFTSLSAVEKFLVPYYARMKDLRDVAKMRDNFANSTVTAAAFHLPTSYEGLAVDGGIVFAKLVGNELQPMSFSEFVS